MSVEKVEYHAADAPADLPSRDTIIRDCAAAGYCQNGICFKVEGILDSGSSTISASP
jgi:hypothetical protein